MPVSPDPPYSLPEDFRHLLPLPYFNPSEDAEQGLPWFKAPNRRFILHTHALQRLAFLGFLSLWLIPMWLITVGLFAIDLPLSYDWTNAFASLKSAGATLLIVLLLLLGLFCAVRMPSAAMNASTIPARRLMLLLSPAVNGRSAVFAASGVIAAAISLLGTVLYTEFHLLALAKPAWPLVDERFDEMFQSLTHRPGLDLWFAWLDACALGALVTIVREAVATARFRRAMAGGQLVQKAPTAATFSVVMMSDLHITATDASYRTEPGVNANPRFRFLLEQASADLAQADGVLFCGDLTDAGLGRDWKSFFQIIEHARALDVRRQVVLVPGNHDLNIYNPNRTKPQRHVITGGEDLLSRKIRQIRFLYALWRVQGHRSQILGADNELRAFEEYFLPFVPFLEIFRLHPPQRKVRGAGSGQYERDVTPEPVRQLIELPDKVWQSVFPLVTEVQQASGRVLRVIVLDSNRTSTHAVSNAFGHVSENQLLRLARIIEICRRDTCPFIVALHHCVGGFWKVNERACAVGPPLAERLKEGFLSLENAPELIHTLLQAQETVVLQGHRHEALKQTVHVKEATLHLVSGPSSTLGDGTKQGIVSLDRLAVSSDGGQTWLSRVDDPPLRFEVTGAPSGR
jgi:3',5'-cyclic AMP phosphodiesterase CpdA